MDRIERDFRLLEEAKFYSPSEPEAVLPPAKKRKERKNLSKLARQHRSLSRLARQGKRGKLFRQAQWLKNRGNEVVANHLMRQRDQIRPASKRDRDQRLNGRALKPCHTKN